MPLRQRHKSWRVNAPRSWLTPPASQPQAPHVPPGDSNPAAGSDKKERSARAEAGQPASSSASASSAAGGTTKVNTKRTPRSSASSDSWLPGNAASVPLWRTKSPLAGLKSPDWVPEWLDPLLPESDLRVWLLPYLILPYLGVQVIKMLAISPLMQAELLREEAAVGVQAGFFRLRTEQVERAEVEAEHFRSHLEFEQLMHRAPPLREEEVLDAVRSKLATDEHEALVLNCRATTDLLADGLFVTAGGINALWNLAAVRQIQSRVGREFFHSNPSRQAFLLLLVSDILVGYHSSEGWATLLSSIADHYGFDERKDLTALFIAVVPVSFDVVFKYWCYSSLRNWAPDTQVILDEIDH